MPNKSIITPPIDPIKNRVIKLKTTGKGFIKKPIANNIVMG